MFNPGHRLRKRDIGLAPEGAGFLIVPNPAIQAELRDRGAEQRAVEVHPVAQRAPGPIHRGSHHQQFKGARAGW